jgi:hypothetical protein
MTKPPSFLCLATLLFAACQTPYSQSEERDPLGYVIESETESQPNDPVSRLMDSGQLQ